MPGLARKLLISAAVDGLVIQPLVTRSSQAQSPSQSPSPSPSYRTPQPVKIKYGDPVVTAVTRDQLPDTSRPNSSFEAFGIIGVFTVSRLSYLVSITGRQQVAHVRGCPVYVVTDVALIPCTNQQEATSAIAHTSTQLRQAAAARRGSGLYGAKKTDDADVATETDTDSEVEVPSAGDPSGDGDGCDDPGSHSDRELSKGNSRDSTASASAGRASRGARSSVAEDVIKNKGSYGRFAQRWFGNKGWMADQKRNPGLSGVGPSSSRVDSAPAKTKPDDKDLSESVIKENASLPPAPSAGETLAPKLLRMAHIWFGTSQSFFFSYDLDLTRSLAARTQIIPGAPLHKSADPTYFWNRHLLKPFFAAGDESLLLPIMQGFVGQRAFVVDRSPPQMDSQKDSLEMDEMAARAAAREGEALGAERSSTDLRASEQKFLITLISRRSVERAGLRYLRRGVDEEGNSANSVETEQILSTPRWGADSKTFSFVQVRGSIPLFFTQSPYSLKPLPVLQHSPEANYRAFKKHCDRMGRTYGSLQLVNLVEKHGVESIVGNEYERNARRFNDERVSDTEPLDFEWFDFHSACRGMKFENVSLLLDTLSQRIDASGSTVETNNEVTRRQKGVLRTNCMDCLDRTNVCQSSFAKFVLDTQLRELGFDMAAQADQDTTWFNTLWADNGDAISKQYASTAAMKGDYTRTRKRDYRGMVNDLGLSLTRFYNGMVNDYFSQAAIDFFLGNVTSLVFDEFEANMMTKDPGVSMQRMREQAIETSAKIAIEDPDREDMVGGWTLLSPCASNTVQPTSSSSTSPSQPFEEVVLLLTDTALYLCRFDWRLDKVQSFERVDLSHVLGIRVGTYITSTISPAQADEAKNVGLVITYKPGKRDVVRTNTRSLSSMSISGLEQTPGPGDAASKAPVDAAPPSSPSKVASFFNQGILSAIAGTGSRSTGAADGGRGPGQGDPRQQEPRLIALKAPYSHTSISDARGVERMTERETVDLVAGEIERLALANQPARRGRARPPLSAGGGDADSGRGGQQGEGEAAAAADRGQSGEDRGLIEAGDIISLAEAKRSTSLLDQLGHSIKKLVWA